VRSQKQFILHAERALRSLALLLHRQSTPLEMTMLRGIRGVLLGVCAGLLVVAPASAQSIESFYKGKRLTMLVGSAVGGGYDAYARFVGRHLGRFIPGNPVFVVQNMPGAAGAVAASNLYNVAARDGTVMEMFQRETLIAPLLESRNIENRYEARKFNWLGSLNSETGVSLAWHTAPHKTAADLFDKELIVGAEGGGTSDSELFARLTNAVLGTRARIVTGYKGSVDVLLAMEKGEVNGTFVGGWTGLREKASPWLATGEAKLLVQLAVRPDPTFLDVPVILDYAHDERQRQILQLAFTAQLWGRPYVAPPDLPPERAQALRVAFLATMRDPAFLAEAKKMRFDIGPLSGEEMAGLIRGLYALPADIIQATREAFRGDRK
jgi:tripartite-type tricarboxylate transporter receptor subunit TctC